MKLEKKKIVEIKPYWRNPRKNEGAVAVVKASIEAYGQQTPILVDDNYVIVAGHSRYKALMQLNYKEVHITISNLSPKKVKEYRIADNLTSEHAEWDYMNLIPELREIENIEKMQIYFKNIDVNSIIKSSVGSVNFKDIAQNQIDKIEDELNTKFVDNSVSTKIEVTCPHCLEDFFFDKSQFEKFN